LTVDGQKASRGRLPSLILDSRPLGLWLPVLSTVHGQQSTAGAERPP